jgi:hypothetical protein
VPNLSLSFNVLAGIALMIPLSKKYYFESVLAFIAAAALGALFVNVHILPYVFVTGSYTIAAVFLYEKRVKAFIAVPVAAAYSILAFFILWKAGVLFLELSKLRLNLNSTLLYVVMNAVFTAAFIVYHYLIIWIYKFIGPKINRISK